MALFLFGATFLLSHCSRSQEPDLIDRIAGTYVCTCEVEYAPGSVSEVIQRNIPVQRAGGSRDTVSVEGYKLPLAREEPDILFKFPYSTFRYARWAAFFPEQDSIYFYQYQYNDFKEICQGRR